MVHLQQEVNENTQALTQARDETASAETAAGVLKVCLRVLRVYASVLSPHLDRWLLSGLDVSSYLFSNSSKRKRKLPIFFLKIQAQNAALSTRVSELEAALAEATTCASAAAAAAAADADRARREAAAAADADRAAEDALAHGTYKPETGALEQRLEKVGVFCPCPVSFTRSTPTLSPPFECPFLCPHITTIIGKPPPPIPVLTPIPRIFVFLARDAWSS